jgi:hypothetical protein
MAVGQVRAASARTAAATAAGLLTGVRCSASGISVGCGGADAGGGLARAVFAEGGVVGAEDH